MNAPFTLIACVTGLLVASPVQAQLPRPERPYRGLFGGGVGETEQLLAVTAASGGGYGSNLSNPEGASGLLPGVASSTDTVVSGAYSYFAGRVDYTLSRTRFAVTASAGGATQGYPDPIGKFVSSYGVSGSATLNLTRRISLGGSHSISFQPYYVLGFLSAPDPTTQPRGAAASVPNLVATPQEHVAQSTAVRLGANTSRRGSLEVAHFRQRSDFKSSTLDLSVDTTHARYSHGLGRGLAARVGYGATRGRYGAAPDAVRPVAHNIDVGLDLARTLSMSRRTTVAFRTGSAALVAEEYRSYHLTGEARLTHEIGRSWTATVMYSRGVEFVDVIRQPVLADAVTAAVNGLLHRRLQFRSSVGTSRGAIGVGLPQGPNNYRSAYANAAVVQAISRHLGAGAEYYWYRHLLDPAAIALAEVMPEFSHNGVRGYLTVWAPIVHRARRPDASR